MLGLGEFAYVYEFFDIKSRIIRAGKVIPRIFVKTKAAKV